MMLYKTVEEMLLLIDEIAYVDDLIDSNTKNYHSDRIKVSLRPTKGLIVRTEEALKTRLPLSYITFNLISNWWSFNCSCNLICYPFTVNDFENVFLPNIIDVNNYLRSAEFYKYDCSYVSRIPDYFIVCDSSYSGDDDYYCFDTRYFNKEGECPVVYWSPALNEGENQNIELKGEFQSIYPNFSTYMFSKICQMETANLEFFRVNQYIKLHKTLHLIKNKL